MEIKSALADMTMSVGRMRARAGRLVLEAGADSSLPATVYMTPADVMRAAWAFLRAPSAWGFVLFAPVLAAVQAMRRRSDGAAESGPYPGYDLNNPWANE